MTNYAIARVFTRIADLMEIQGENPFKIRAYRSAAATMQELAATTSELNAMARRLKAATDGFQLDRASEEQHLRAA